MEWSELILRVIIFLLVLYVWARLLGKKLISQMTFFDFIAGITIGSLASNVMVDRTIGIATGVAAISLFSLLIILLNYLALKNFISRKVLEGEPTILIKNGAIFEEGLNKVRFTVDNLLSNLRKKNVFYVEQVESAILETDGTVSVLLKPEYQSLTPKDMSVYKPSRGLTQAFIIDGKILKHSLQIINKDIEWVNSILEQHQIKDIESVFYAQIDEQGVVYIDTKIDRNT